MGVDDGSLRDSPPSRQNSNKGLAEVKPVRKRKLQLDKLALIELFLINRLVPSFLKSHDRHLCASLN